MRLGVGSWRRWRGRFDRGAGGVLVRDRSRPPEAPAATPAQADANFVSGAAEPDGAPQNRRGAQGRVVSRGAHHRHRGLGRRPYDASDHAGQRTHCAASGGHRRDGQGGPAAAVRIQSRRRQRRRHLQESAQPAGLFQENARPQQGSAGSQSDRAERPGSRGAGLQRRQRRSGERPSGAEDFRRHAAGNRPGAKSGRRRSIRNWPCGRPSPAWWCRNW